MQAIQEVETSFNSVVTISMIKKSRMIKSMIDMKIRKYFDNHYQEKIRIL